MISRSKPALAMRMRTYFAVGAVHFELHSCAQLGDELEEGLDVAGCFVGEAFTDHLHPPLAVRVTQTIILDDHNRDPFAVGHERGAAAAQAAAQGDR